MAVRIGSCVPLAFLGKRVDPVVVKARGAYCPLHKEPPRHGECRKAQGPCLRLRVIFAAPAREQALQIASSVAEKWRKKGNEKVAEHIEEHIEECLACLAFPESHRRRIRTTNGLERFNQELKRRTRVVRIFPNRESCLRLVTALAAETSEEWVTGRRYLDMGRSSKSTVEQSDKQKR